MYAYHNFECSYFKKYSVYVCMPPYVRRVTCGNFAICDVGEETTIIETPYSEWLWRKDKTVYTIEAEGVRRAVWFCEIVQEHDVEILTRKSVTMSTLAMPEIEFICGRCVPSMTYLDRIHRTYVNTLDHFNILAIKSVAGSGKTTTLLNMAKTHASKRILYLAFNKSLVEDISNKCPPNMVPKTFDALLYGVFAQKIHAPSNIMHLKPYTIGKVFPWLDDKSYKLKQNYCNAFETFCNQTKKDTCEDKILAKLWKDALAYSFYTFGTIRKMCQVKRLCRDVIDTQYDMIFIDETQDFDELMLKILLEDTTIPKVFVGDPLQAIYGWRGCINAFDKLPVAQTKTVEFYTTFRVGNPACRIISSKFKNCWMITGANHETHMDQCIPEGVKYTYLFRTWKELLHTATRTPRTWIYNFTDQIERIRKLHAKVSKKYTLDDEKYEDDLPLFLSKLSSYELDTLIRDIEKNIVSKEECICEMYTVHSYKGLEDDYVKVHPDVTENNVHYVALTRGRKSIVAPMGVDPTKVNALVNMGFQRTRVVDALDRADGSFHDALKLLFKT